MNTPNLPPTALSAALSATFALLGLASLSGCTTEDEHGDADLRLGYDLDCPRWRCGYNSAEVNGKSVRELRLDGQANADGVAIAGFLPPLGGLLGWELGVEGDSLVARGGLLGTSTLRGAQLVGSTILFDLGEGLSLPVLIAGYEEVEAWGAGDPIAAYSLVYLDLDGLGLQRSVCQGTLTDPLLASVVVLAGERYDEDTKTVVPDQDGWITLGCAGSASAKLALLGYGPHGDVDGEGTSATVAQRQATLKMITADYCGTGEAHTVDGVPLEWENQAGTVVPATLPPAGSLEAIWTEAGALCLDEPRLGDGVVLGCELPSCGDLTLDDGEWATYAVLD